MRWKVSIVDDARHLLELRTHHLVWVLEVHLMKGQMLTIEHLLMGICFQRVEEGRLLGERI